MSVNDALDIGETDSGSFEVIRAVEALEHSEEFIDVPHIEADDGRPHFGAAHA